MTRKRKRPTAGASIAQGASEAADMAKWLPNHPIANIRWIPVAELHANAWNPNHVLAPEMKLIELSLLTQGWIQPILVNREEDGFQIIDGFHRSTLAKTSDKVRALTDGHVPCAILDLSRGDRMLLTVRINRAKGSHQAHLMHELVTALVNEEGFTVKEVCRQIGADKHEVDTLLAESVFKKLDVENTPYSKAWRPP